MEAILLLVLTGASVSGCSTTVYLNSPLDANRKIDDGSATLPDTRPGRKKSGDAEVSRENKANDAYGWQKLS